MVISFEATIIPNTHKISEIENVAKRTIVFVLLLLICIPYYETLPNNISYIVLQVLDKKRC